MITDQPSASGSPEEPHDIESLPSESGGEQMAAFDDDALWDELTRRQVARVKAQRGRQEDPEWRGRWELPRARPSDRPVRSRHLYAALDAVYVRQCLADAGLQEVRSPHIVGGGFVVVASDVPLVFHWGEGFRGRLHALTAARTMLQAYTDILEHRGIVVDQEYSTELPELRLRCRVPRSGVDMGGARVQLAAMFDERAAAGPERDDRDRRLAIEAARRIVADLAEEVDIFAFLEPSHRLHVSPAVRGGSLRMLDSRGQYLLHSLLEFHLTGQMPAGQRRGRKQRRGIGRSGW
jgi:hypothetical protein